MRSTSRSKSRRRPDRSDPVTQTLPDDKQLTQLETSCDSLSLTDLDQSTGSSSFHNETTSSSKNKVTMFDLFNWSLSSTGRQLSTRTLKAGNLSSSRQTEEDKGDLPHEIGTTDAWSHSKPIRVQRKRSKTVRSHKARQESREERGRASSSTEGADCAVESGAPHSAAADPLEFQSSTRQTPHNSSHNDRDAIQKTGHSNNDSSSERKTPRKRSESARRRTHRTSRTPERTKAKPADAARAA